MLGAVAPTPEEIAHAAAVLRAGGLVAFPTETVYGLGADAEQPDAVRRIFSAKSRPESHPLIVHLASAREIQAWARRVPPAALALAAKFWPGPLTMVLERASRVPDAVTGGLDTVALRVPAHPVALALLEAFGGAIAAPSANRFGHVSPTTAAHVREDLGDAVDVVLDGGAATIGVESTIVDLSSNEPAMLRPGGLPRDAIETVLGRPLASPRAGSARAPGMLPTHYAPRARVEIARAEQLAERARACAQAGERAAIIVRGQALLVPGVDVIVLPARAQDAAPRLYDALREVDRRGVAAVFVALPEPDGLDEAIADRLRRAAGLG